MISSVADYLVSIQQNIIRYGFPILLTLGNIGNLLTIIIFSQKRHRKSSGSLYLLFSAIFGLIGVNCALGWNLNSIYQSPDPFTVSVAFCRIRGYILQITSVLYRTMIVLVCIDRFALSSSHATIRNFNRRKIALKIVVGVTVFWMIASIHQLIFQTIKNKRCYVFGSYGLFFSIYQVFIFGLLLPTLMIILGILLEINLNRIRIRTHRLRIINNSQHQRILRQRDLRLMKMALVEVCSTILLSVSYPINVLYSVLTSDVPNKSQDRIRIEGFTSFITLNLLFYLNYYISFYLYIAASNSFRHEVKRFISKCLQR